MATGQTRNIAGIAPRKTAISGRIPTGTTIGEIFSNLPDQKLWGYDGSIVFEYGTKSFLNLTGGTITGNTIINGNLTVTGNTSLQTLSATTLISGSTNLYDIFHQKSGYLLQKAGMVSGSSFSGNPDKAVVTFTTNFPDNNYAISIVGTVNRTWTIESKTLSGFTINSNANPGFPSNEVYWTATEIGEGYR